MKSPTPQFLTEKEKRYLYKYAEIGDPRKALREVFGDVPYSKHDEIFSKPIAQKYYKRMIDKVDSEFASAAGASLRKLRTMTAVNLDDIIDPHTGQLRPDVPNEYFNIVKSIRYDPETGAVTHISTVDKLRSLELMMKHQGLLNKKVDVSVNVSIAEQLKSSQVADEEVDALLANEGIEVVDVEITETEREDG